MKHRQLSSELCDDLHGWDGVVGRKGKERIYAYIQPILFHIQQKLTQHGKPITLQLKKKKKRISKTSFNASSKDYMS